MDNVLYCTRAELCCTRAVLYSTLLGLVQYITTLAFWAGKAKQILAWLTPMKAKSTLELKTNVFLLGTIFLKQLKKKLWTIISPKRLELLILFQKWELGQSISYHLIRNLPTHFDIACMAEMFVLINHFWLCAAVVSHSQQQSKWFRHNAIKR